MNTYKSPFILILFVFITMVSPAQSDPRAYAIYDQNGAEITFSEMAEKLSKADIVLFGELHNNSVIHWLQLELTSRLYELKKDHALVLGAEMFEADDQLVVDEYLAGLIKHKHLTSEAKVWNNYETDYRPLLEFAKEHQLPFIATNIPRRYASIVANKGLEGLEKLQERSREYMMPLPLVVDTNTPGYKEIQQMQHGGKMGSGNFVNAQASKDATMAHFIVKNLKKGQLFLHFNGDFHSRQYGGIYWYLHVTQPKLKIMTISSTESDQKQDSSSLSGLADYIIITPENVTKTY